MPAPSQRRKSPAAGFTKSGSPARFLLRRDGAVACQFEMPVAVAGYDTPGELHETLKLPLASPQQTPGPPPRLRIVLLWKITLESL